MKEFLFDCLLWHVILIYLFVKLADVVVVAFQEHFVKIFVFAVLGGRSGTVVTTGIAVKINIVVC